MKKEKKKKRHRTVVLSSLPKINHTPIEKSTPKSFSELPADRRFVNKNNNIKKRDELLHPSYTD